VRSDHHAGTIWSPRGALRFMIVDGKVNADTFIEFCKRLLHGATRPIFLIVDGHLSHKAKKVSKWIEAQEGHLELFLLPGYSPDLNPRRTRVEWAKNHALGKLPHRDKPTMRKAAESYLRLLQRSPSRIRALFQKPSVRYAA
jgi:transposase